MTFGGAICEPLPVLLTQPVRKSLVNRISVVVGSDPKGCVARYLADRQDITFFGLHKNVLGHVRELAD